MKTRLTILAAIALIALCSCKKEESMKALADRVFTVAEVQMKAMDSTLEAGSFPRSSAPDGSFVKSDMRWWCSGFYPGSLWYVYEYTGNEEFKTLAEKYTNVLEGLIGRRTDHDLGFQINCSYGNAYRLTSDEKWLDVYIKAAEQLSTRFSEKVGAIQSWDFTKWSYPVIIDNMMNLELLEKASRYSGNPRYATIAETHADKTMANHFRPDYTTWHLVNYDAETGEALDKVTVQGWADDSAWARGQAWALYGFTMMAVQTGKDSYLHQAESIARWLLANLPEDSIPYWDFAEDREPKEYRDASAGAIMASAFAQLGLVSEDKDLAKQCLAMAEKQVRTLAGPDYLAAEGENNNFLLRHSVGSLPGRSEVDVPLTYADYYFLEAILRLIKH